MFVADEPNNRAGVYGEHLIWRFENLLGRTMWEFQAAAEEPKFLVIARLDGGQEAPTTLRPPAAAHLPADLRKRLLLYGALTTPDVGDLVGVALALQVPGRKVLDAVLREERLGLDSFPDVEVHDWELGGRRRVVPRGRRRQRRGRGG